MKSTLHSSSCARVSTSSSSAAIQASDEPLQSWGMSSGIRQCQSCRFAAGQIKADGGDQQKFDDGMREMRKAGIQVACIHIGRISVFLSQGP